jgi:aquaporin Z
MEFLLTFIFVSVILGSTSKRATSGFAGIPIGLTLTLVHLVGIPITNLSVNPARSTGPALFVGGWAMSQLWIFWIAPIAGGFAAGLLGNWLHEDDAEPGVVKSVEPAPEAASSG